MQRFNFAWCGLIFKMVIDTESCRAIGYHWTDVEIEGDSMAGYSKFKVSYLTEETKELIRHEAFEHWFKKFEKKTAAKV